MKIAVIGAGTAGYIAAAHLSKNFTNFKIYHIYNTKIPTIGVGEGTTLYFPQWLEKLTGLSYGELAQKYYVTRKYGIIYENWGHDVEQFFHNFFPLGENYAYHIAADKIVELLQQYVNATTIDKQVIDVKSDGISVKIEFEDNSHLEVDVAIDARGFPPSLEDEQINISLIPTNAALIRQGGVVKDGIMSVKVGNEVFQYQSATRSIARPHGWIFVIPLTHRTSYGYIYNSTINSISEIEKDFDEFLTQENVREFKTVKSLNFPNFCQRSFFDGALFKIGNVAAFLEPLEATAIGFTLKQVEMFSYWPLNKFAQLEKREKLTEKDLKVFNQHLYNYVLKMAVFVSWHYAMGSPFNSKFWQMAVNNYQQEIQLLDNQEVKEKFNFFLQAASEYPHPNQDFNKFASVVMKSLPEKIIQKKNRVFGQWMEPSFAQIGYGIGYFN